jgi:hypothetical protein
MLSFISKDLMECFLGAGHHLCCFCYFSSKTERAGLSWWGKELGQPINNGCSEYFGTLYSKIGNVRCCAVGVGGTEQAQWILWC